MDKDDAEKLYFVLETKGATSSADLRGGDEGSEPSKIKCGVRHFAALNNGVVFSEKPVRDWREFKVGV